MQCPMRSLRLFVVHFLQIVGKDERRHPSFANSNTNRSIDQMTNLRWRRCLLHECTSNILEHRGKIEFLLIVSANRRARLLTCNCQNRHMIKFRVIQTSQEMRGSWPRSGDANAKFAGELRIGRCHERSHLLMPRLDEFDFPVGSIKCAKDAIYPIACKTIDFPYAPRMQTIDNKITNCAAHGRSSRGCHLNGG